MRSAGVLRLSLAAGLWSLPLVIAEEVCEAGEACDAADDAEAEVMKVQLLQSKHHGARKSASQIVQDASANASAGIFKCGKQYCTPGSLCCDEAPGGGQCASVGSSCCGKTICSPGSTCCGTHCASPGSICCEGLGSCSPGSSCCPSGLSGRNMCCSPGYRCCPPETGMQGCCPIPKDERTVECGKLKCITGSICCEESEMCGTPGSSCCNKTICSPGSTCCGNGICAGPGGICCGGGSCGPGATCCDSGIEGKKMCCGSGEQCCPAGSGYDGCCPMVSTTEKSAGTSEESGGDDSDTEPAPVPSPSNQGDNPVDDIKNWFR